QLTVHVTGSEFRDERLARGFEVGLHLRVRAWSLAGLGVRERNLAFHVVRRAEGQCFGQAHCERGLTSRAESARDVEQRPEHVELTLQFGKDLSAMDSASSSAASP